MLYRNDSHKVMTFYGVKFNPGDVKDVPGNINHPRFVRVASMPPATASMPKPVSKAAASTKATKPVAKTESLSAPDIADSEAPINATEKDGEQN